MQQRNFGKEDVILSSISSLFQVEIISAAKKKGKKKRLKMKFASSVLRQCPVVNCGAYYTSNFFIPTI